MIRRITLTLCVAVLAGVATLPETASANAPTASAGTMTVASAHSAKRSGYIVASS